MNDIIESLQNLIINNISRVEITSWENQVRFLGVKLIDVGDLSFLFIRFTFNTLLIFTVVHFMYARYSKRKDFYFSYLSIGVVVFLMSFMLNNVKLELGFALGLFAIFGIIRYRTSPIPIKEMTYLFIVIGISVMNALASTKISYAELLFTNGVLISGLWLLEKRLMLRQEGSIKLIYEKIEKVNGLNDVVLLADLKDRTGIDINRYEIKKIDYLKDVAHLVLYFSANGNNKQMVQGDAYEFK